MYYSQKFVVLLLIVGVVEINAASTEVSSEIVNEFAQFTLGRRNKAQENKERGWRNAERAAEARIVAAGGRDKAFRGPGKLMPTRKQLAEARGWQEQRSNENDANRD